MDTTLSRELYDRWHADLPADAESDAPWHDLVRKHLRPQDVAGRSLLEIGCGRGGFSCWLASQAEPPARLVGADFSAAAIDKARELAERMAINSVDWRVADIERLPFEDNTFDTVISCETIEHVPSPRVAVAELARVLRPRGRLLLSTPNYLGGMGLYRAYLRCVGRRYTEGGQPINHFNMLPRTRRWVAAAGLRIVTSDGTGHYLPVPGRRPIEMRWLNSPRILMHWLALHSLVIAEKPAA